MFRAVLNNDTKIYRTFLVGSQPTDVDASALPTVSVVRADGTVLAAPTAVNEEEIGQYSITLTAATYADQLDRLKVTWTGTVGGLAVEEVQYVDVVGGRYFDLHALRSMEGLSSTSKYSDLYLEVVRSEVEATFEDHCEISFVPTVRTEIFDASEYRSSNVYSGFYDNDVPYYGLFLRWRNARTLVSIKLSGVAETLSNWTLSKGGQIRSEGFSPDVTDNGQEIEVSYIHGFDQPPADLRRAALRYARHLAISNVSTVPDRSRLMQTEFGLFVLDHPGDKMATGLHEVDAVLNRYAEESPGSFA